MRPALTTVLRLAFDGRTLVLGGRDVVHIDSGKLDGAAGENPVVEATGGGGVAFDGAAPCLGAVGAGLVGGAAGIGGAEAVEFAGEGRLPLRRHDPLRGERPFQFCSGALTP